MFMVAVILGVMSWHDPEPEPIIETETYEATFYTAYCEGCIGVTKTGYDVKNTIYTPEGDRVIAVDPKVIPLHSLVRITLEDGTTFTAKALDIGGAIKNKRIDILVETKKEAFRLGRQKVEVEIIREGTE